MAQNFMISHSDRILVTGANGFIGSKVVEKLLEQGFNNIRCFVRPSGRIDSLEKIKNILPPDRNIEIFKGNLLSREDCEKSTKGVAVIYHLAASLEKSFPGSVLNCVVTTRNLLDGAVTSGTVKRFVNVSSFSVYSNYNLKHNSLLDETCPIEDQLLERFDTYVYAKVKQEKLVEKYHLERGLPFVHVRPGVVYGPGSTSLSGRVGIDTFGIFFHIGGNNRLPLTYVDNCAEAIILAGVREGVDGSSYNIVDDDPPTCRHFLKRYKKNYKNFKSIYVPYHIFYMLCFLWEKYSYWSHFQLPPSFNRRKCSASWKGNTYSNDKIKIELGWDQKMNYEEASRIYFDSLRNSGGPN